MLVGCPDPRSIVLSFLTMILVIFIFSCTLLSSSAYIDHYSSDAADAGFGLETPFSLSDIARRDENVENVKDFFDPLSSSRRRREKRTTEHNLCERECSCMKKTHFLTVECNLTKNQQYIFGLKNFLPKEATSLVVKLSAKGSLRIETDFLKQSKVNRISLIGEIQKNKIHVEFRSNATANSLAPNPEIEVRNCHTLILREKSISGDIKLNIRNCDDVIIFENALYATKFVGVIDEVRDLRIAEHAFYKAHGNLRIFRSYIENLYRFDAFFNQIGFYNCTIGNVTGKTFDVIQISAIIFDNCRIKVINTEAMSEKLLSNHLKITGGYIETIESHAIYGVGIRELVLSNNEIEVIQSNAIKVTAANASITNNRIFRVGLKWLRISDWNNVIVSNNTFGEFNLMLLDTKNNKSKQCLFEKNLITRALPGSLNFTNKNCIIREIAFDRLCKCLEYDNWLDELSSRDIRSESYCGVDKQLQFCFNRTQLNVLKYENEVCSDSSETLDCMKQNNLKIIDGRFISHEELESTGNSSSVIIIGTLSAIILCSILGLAICCFKRKGNSIMAQSFAANQALDTRSRFSKEDTRIINETLDMAKQNYSNIYEQLNRHVHDILRIETDERQCVEKIGLILEIIKHCEDSRNRFGPFIGILRKLLDPAEHIQETHVYAEPAYAGNVPIGQPEIEHIYSEPNNVQQPLLTNEYATPADKNFVPVVYAEPVSNNIENYFTPPYAAITPNNNKINYNSQQSSTSNQIQMAKAQEMPENFANNPNFHINRSPNTKRRIPKYTISTKTKLPPGPSQPRPETGLTSPETSSNHSGGSDATVQIDDIDYADA